MLKKIFIQNFAIIEKLEVSFENGFAAITGETGAGKSILLGALGLVLGKRADTVSLLNKEQKCIVEVEFDARSYSRVKEWLLKEQEEETDQLLLRREINNTGKSRAFINDSPVNLTQLKELTSLLVDLHQQFDTLELKEESFQRQVIDALCNNTKDVEVYHSRFTNYTKLQKELQELKDEQLRSANEKDYNQFLLNELEQAHFTNGELEELENELKLQNNAENVSLVLSECYQLLNENETPLVSQIKQLINRLQVYKELLPALGPVIERMQSAQIELNDIGNELEHMQQTVMFDAQRIQIIQERLETGYKLLKKHHLRTTDELLQLQQQLIKKLELQFNQQEIIAQKEKELKLLHEHLETEAEKIHQKRKLQQPLFEKNVNTLLQRVGMPNARLKVLLQHGVLNSYGKDEIDFLFDANKSNRFESIDKVASGGELSRLMLCIKSLVASVVELPTMIFDEIDTGISGEAARQVGLLLQELSKKHQVIVITHLPQIAARAKTHYYVYKEQTNHTLQTKIKLLNLEEQVETIARMLSGEKITDSSITTAREMVLG